MKVFKTVYMQGLPMIKKNVTMKNLYTVSVFYTLISFSFNSIFTDFKKNTLINSDSIYLHLTCPP